MSLKIEVYKCNLWSKPIENNIENKISKNNIDRIPKKRKLFSVLDFGLKSNNDFLIKIDNNSKSNNIIKCKYNDNLNIVSIHKKILNIFKSNRKLIGNLYKKVSKIDQKILSLETNNYISYISLSKKKKKLLEKIDEIKNKKDEIKYIKESQDLINQFIKLNPKEKKVKFGESLQGSMNNKIYEIIDKYLIIARKYIDIDIIREIEKDNKCIYCGESLENTVLSFDGSFSCPNCFVEIEYIYKLSTPTSSSNNKPYINNYKDRKNFCKALYRYQGKQNITFPNELWTMLDLYFSKFNLPLGKEIKKLPLSKDGKKRGNTNKIMMIKALKEIGFSNFYEDINLICNIYWGWPLPDVSNLEVKIMEDYDISQRVLERKDVKGNIRRSCLNSQYRLFRHLQKVGYKCNFTEFKIVTTDEIFRYHERTWKKACDILGWKFIPIE